MKYRYLTNEELKELEPEFKQFLISNNIYTEEWEELNKKQAKKVDELVGMFSDIVLEQSLKKIKYLEHITSNAINAFRCDATKMVLIGITSPNKNIDFSKNTLADFANDLDIFKTSKPYYKERELEVFELLQSGCHIIKEERFRKLEMAHQYSTKRIKN